MNWPSKALLRQRLSELLRYAAIFAGVYLLASHFVRRSSGPKEGSPAAAFDLPLLGETGRVSLAALRGKPVILEVFASWCSACKRSAPRLTEAFRAHRGENVTFLGVSVDDDPAAASHIKSDWKIPFAVALDDGSVSRNYSISLLPTLIYIDKNGLVRHASAGVASRSDLEAWLAEP